MFVNMNCCKIFIIQLLFPSFLCLNGEVWGSFLETPVSNLDNYENYLATNSPTSASPTLPTGVPIVTMKPASKVRYRLNLTNPGPSVLDSTLSFEAELKTDNGDEIPKDMKFSFLWMNMADLKAHRTEDHFKASIPLSFSSDGNDTIDAGDYTMTVVASEVSNPSKILAFQTKKFVLTKNLNGHLNLQQNLEYQRLPNTFSTGKEFTANAVILDHFQAQQTPRFQFFWYEDERFIITTELPQVVTTVNKPGNFSLKSEVLATMAVNRNNEDKDTGSVTERKNGAGIHVVNDVKNGDFTQKVYFKDPLVTCYIDRVDTRRTDRDVKVGVPAVINVTCEGSAPTAVCLNVTRYNKSAPLGTNQSCQPETFIDGLHHQVNVRLNQTGWHDVHFYVFNDVSQKRYTLAYYAYDPDSANLPALVLPIVFVTLGFLVVVGGAVYIMRLRKKPLVEVADFDFHPTLNGSSSGGTSSMRLSLVANTIKYMMTRRKWSGSRQSKSAAANPSKLSELEESGSSFRSEDGAHLYEAL